MRSRMCRRDLNHDYRAPGFYMITLSKFRGFNRNFCRVFDGRREQVDFSLGRGVLAPSVKRIIRFPLYLIPFYGWGESAVCSGARAVIEPVVLLSDFGALVREAFTSFFREHRCLVLRKIVIMPDHIHFIVKVTGCLDKHHGHYLGELKGVCTAAVREVFPESLWGMSGESLFEPNFHDRIIRNADMYGRERLYLENNPRRLLLRRLFPDAFRAPVKIELNGAEMSAFGNIGLLDSPIIDLLVVRTRFGEKELGELRMRWDIVGRQGGVVVSPLISPKEWAMCRKAIEAGASVIRIMDNGFRERYKPAMEWDELLVEGRYLEIGQAEYLTRREPMSKSKAMAMNRFARSIAHSYSRLFVDL